MHPLDNPMWSSLAGAHAHFAAGDDAARRYPADVARFAGMRVPDAAGYAALAGLLQPGEVAALFLPIADPQPPGWQVPYARDIDQMVCETPLAAPDLALDELGEADLPDIMPLIELAKPGPFLPGTLRMGRYLGLHVNGALAAMAGERVHPEGHVEVSAVCSHPDHRGRGYGRLLTQAVSHAVQARGLVPMLHVKTDNADALRAYEALGYRRRRTIHLRVVRPPDA